MKKLIIALLCLMLGATSAYGAISYTKNWSSANDGETFGGDDIKNIQDDISEQTATLAGDNAFSGTNTFSGTNNFTGTVTGISSAKDTITRGFELTFGSVEQVIVEVGTLYHGTTQVDKTANVHLDITTAGDYLTGVSQRGTSKFLYVYVGSAGTVDFDATAPDKSDISGDTEGTLIYYLYSSTYYRCIGAVLLNATGFGEITKFYSYKDMTFYDSRQQELTAGTAASWTDVDCASSVPSISRVAYIQLTNGANNVRIRPNGSRADPGYYQIQGTSQDVVLMMPTDASQIIEYEVSSGVACDVYVLGYKSDIR